MTAAERLPYRGPDDLRELHDFVARLWSRDPRACTLHPGDLAWGSFCRTDVTAALPRNLALWRRDGQVVAYGCVEAGETLDAHSLDDALLPEILDWYLPGREQPAVWASAGDVRLTGLLDERGLRPEEALPLRHLWLDLRRAELEAPLAAGYALRSMDGDGDVDQRVRVHQAAWASERMSREAYANVRSCWLYRADLDWTAVAPDGAFAAYCQGWLDPLTRSALMEPVGTDPEHRRRGLARAVCVAMLRHARELGAVDGYVNCVTDAACAVYASLGFVETGVSRRWVPSR